MYDGIESDDGSGSADVSFGVVCPVVDIADGCGSEAMKNRTGEILAQQTLTESL